MTEYRLVDETRTILKVDTNTHIPVSCYDDLKPYYAYVVGKNGHQEGQKMLKNVFKGEKVIADLIEQTQRGY
jgi:hypothetical protein